MLDRGRAAPARQQRGVEIKAAESRRSQDGRRQQQPIGRGNGGVEAERGEILLERRLAKARGRSRRNAARFGEGLDREGRSRRPRPAGRGGCA